MKKILIFTAGFGEGHNTAARNIRDGIEQIGENAQVEILDLFESTYGNLNQFARKAYLTAINATPKLWQSIYDFFDHSTFFDHNTIALSKMQENLEDLLNRTQPDVVISTYPVYNYLINNLYRNGRERHFTQVTMITDSISINSIWYRTPSDFFLVPNEATSDVLKGAGIHPDKIRVFGFPVQLFFCEHIEDQSRYDLFTGDSPRILYIINSGKKKAPEIIDRLLSHEKWKLTITVGRDQKLMKQVTEQVAPYRDRVQVLGWTSQLPQLMMSHHLVISKAGGATVQETIAARTPLIVSQVVPGQEEGNWELLKRTGAGALAEKPAEIEGWIERCFDKHGKIWDDWHRNLKKISIPDSSLRIARFILEEAVPETPIHHRLKTSLDGFNGYHSSKSASPSGKQMLLCDFHTHTTFSDGKLTVSELVDFYGQRGFDCMAITDHYCDPDRVIGKICNMTGLVLLPQQINEYFDVIEKERKRAWKKYSMILMPGIEFNKDGLSKKSSAHLLGIDLKQPIDPRLDIKSTIHEIHQQGGLAVASHPHEFSSHWGKNTLYLWENQDEYAPLLDAWEIANRDDLFNPIGLKRLPFLANSDFHKPKHIQSWKTLVFSEKDPEAIKQCVRENRDIALTLYRDHRFASELTLPESREESKRFDIVPESTVEFIPEERVLASN
ncbi:MAG: PHP domain-containing protein [Verrucomicrobiota bacterium]